MAVARRHIAHVCAPPAHYVLISIVLIVTTCVTKVDAFHTAANNAPVASHMHAAASGMVPSDDSSSLYMYSTSAAGVDTQMDSSSSNVSSEAPQLSLPVGSRTIRLPNQQGTRMRVFYPVDDKESEGEADEKSQYAPYGTDGRRLSLLAPKMSGSLLDVPMADAYTVLCSSTTLTDDTTTRHWPIFLYSHAIGHNMDTCVLLFESLASRGIVVGALEHTDGTASPFTVRPDGSELKYTEYMMTDRQKLARRAGELLEAAAYLPEETISWHSQTQHQAKFDGGSSVVESCPSCPIVLGGNGYGGAAAVMAANGASPKNNVKGLLLHDPTLGLGYGMLPPNGAGQSGLPTITYISDQSRRAGTLYGTRTLHIKGAKRGRTGSFTDAPLWGALFGKQSMVHMDLVDSMASFLWTRAATSEAVAGGSLIDVVR